MTTLTIAATGQTAEAAGLSFDLSLTWIDVDGSRWIWTGETDHTGMALMQTGKNAPERLSQVYWTYGPLTPALPPVTPADLRDVFNVCPAQDETWPTPRTVAVVLQRLRRRSA